MIAATPAPLVLTVPKLTVPRVVEKVTGLPMIGAPERVHSTCTTWFVFSGTSVPAAGVWNVKLSAEITMSWVSVNPNALAVSVAELPAPGVTLKVTCPLMLVVPEVGATVPEDVVNETERPAMPRALESASVTT